MKYYILILTFVFSVSFTGCDVQSGITKKSVEKFEPTPTPQHVATPVEQIDPADVVAVDVSLDGPKININPSDTKASIDCTKYNRVAINGDGKTISVKGICKQIMVNGDRNQITAVAAAEIVFNGSENNVIHSKYTNGKKPAVQDNGSGNSVAKADPGK